MPPTGYNTGSRKKSEQVLANKRRHARGMKRALGKPKPTDVRLKSNPLANITMSGKKARKLKTATINDLRAQGVEIERADRSEKALQIRTARHQITAQAAILKAADARKPHANGTWTSLGAPPTFAA